MFVLLLLGALVESSYKWAYFAFAIATYFYLVYKLHRPIRRTAVDLHGTGADSPAKPFTRGATYLSIIWPLYFVCWGLSEGGNVIKPLGEMVFYGVLDLITFAAFLLYHTNSLGSHDYSTWGSSRSSRHNGLGRDKATDVPAAHHI
jgi:bacteriorhodopsin